MRAATKLYSICCLLLLEACAGTLNRREYISYVKNEENGLLKKIMVGNFIYRVQYQPIDYLALLESGELAQRNQIKKRREELAGTAWFSISLQVNGAAESPLRYNLTDDNEYNERLSYFLHLAQYQIKLIYGVDTLRPSAYLFENNYNLTPMETMVVGFTFPDAQQLIEKDLTICYNDELFKNGIIKLKYPKQLLNTLPILEY